MKKNQSRKSRVRLSLRKNRLTQISGKIFLDVSQKQYTVHVALGLFILTFKSRAAAILGAFDLE
jgi:hypothetical protein